MVGDRRERRGNRHSNNTSRYNSDSIVVCYRCSIHQNEVLEVSMGIMPLYTYMVDGRVVNRGRDIGIRISFERKHSVCNGGIVVS